MTIPVGWALKTNNSLTATTWLLTGTCEAAGLGVAEDDAGVEVVGAVVEHAVEEGGRPGAEVQLLAVEGDELTSLNVAVTVTNTKPIACMDQ